MLFDLFIFLSSPSTWWTCGFTPTQDVSLLEWYMYTLSYTLRQNSNFIKEGEKRLWFNSANKKTPLLRKFVNATHVCSYLPSSYSLSPIYTEHDNTQLVCNKQLYAQSWTFYLCCDDVDLHQSVMRLHTIIIWTLQLFKHPPPPPSPPFSRKNEFSSKSLLNIRTPSFQIIILISEHLPLAEFEWGLSNFY